MMMNKHIIRSILEPLLIFFKNHTFTKLKINFYIFSENEYPLLDSKPEVGRPSKAIGKKRRARLLSENLKDMKLMNRKRWELKSSADCLKDRRSDDNVQLSVLCQHFTAKGLNPSKDVLAFHQVDNKGVMNSRKSQSQRGFTLSELDVESGEKPLNIKAQSLDKGEKKFCLFFKKKWIVFSSTTYF